MKQSIYTLSACALVAAAMLAGCDKAGNATAPAAAPASAPAAVPPAEPAQQAALTTEVFNPGEKAIFAVSSVLVQGKSEVVLIDAQFSAEQAREARPSLYRWRDDAGVLQITDQPPKGRRCRCGFHWRQPGAGHCSGG